MAGMNNQPSLTRKPMVCLLPHRNNYCEVKKHSPEFNTAQLESVLVKGALCGARRPQHASRPGQRIWVSDLAGSDFAPAAWGSFGCIFETLLPRSPGEQADDE